MRTLIFAVIIFIFSLTAYAEADVFGRPFSDGSPPCTACHSVAAAGYTISAWGPDISSLYVDMGEDAASVADFIKSSGIGPMDAAYANLKVPDEEMNHLVEAFAKLKPEEAQTETGNSITIYAFGLFVILLAAGRIIFRKNRRLEENR